MTGILYPFLTKFRKILCGNIDQCFFEKERFCSSFYSDYAFTIAILKLDFLKSPGKSLKCQAPAQYEIRIYRVIRMETH